MTSHMATGIKRLDDLLGGGIPVRSVTLIYGPPFIGKRLLGRMFLTASMAKGVPGVMINTDHTAAELKDQMSQVDKSFSKYQENGLAFFVDTYSKSIGATDELPGVEYVDGLMNFNALGMALNNVQRAIIKKHEHHGVLFDSVSTLIAYTNAQAAFRYLQVLTGKAKMAGATSLLILEEGMHTEAEVQTIKHLADGIIELRQDKDKNLIAVEGLGLPGRVGWVEYHRTESGLSITGSFAAGRIR